MSHDLSNTGIMNILLVENSKSARASMKTLLSKAKYRVFAVATGPEALQLLENTKVDLIVMDVFMPLMNGYEVTKTIRSSNKHYSEIPIFAYTSSENPRDEQLCLEAGISLYLKKSEDTSNLVSAISQHLNYQ